MNLGVIKPLLGKGLQYVLELGKCLTLSFVLSVVVLVALMKVMPSDRGYGYYLVAHFALFLVLYVLASQQRAISRLMSGVVHAHGDLLFDQTAGRFIRFTESKRPGAVAGMLATPGRLAAGFQDYLAQEGSVIPRPLRRMGSRYVDKLGASLVESGSVPTGAVVNGELREEALRGWAVQNLRDRFEPSWNFYLIVAGLHLATAIVLWWLTRTSA
jgi:hypothetical protein